MCELTQCDPTPYLINEENSDDVAGQIRRGCEETLQVDLVGYVVCALRAVGDGLVHSSQGTRGTTVFLYPVKQLRKPEKQAVISEAQKLSINVGYQQTMCEIQNKRKREVFQTQRAEIHGSRISVYSPLLKCAPVGHVPARILIKATKT